MRVTANEFYAPEQLLGILMQLETRKRKFEQKKQSFLKVGNSFDKFVRSCA
jgi:hypothetical protein